MHLDLTDQFGILCLVQLEYQVPQIGPYTQNIILSNDRGQLPLIQVSIWVCIEVLCLFLVFFFSLGILKASIEQLWA